MVKAATPKSPASGGAPRPLKNELPAEFADRLSAWYVAQSEEGHRKRQGQYFTPLDVARFMSSLARPAGQTLRVLDAGAGTGVLSCALVENLASVNKPPREIDLLAIESEAQLEGLLRRSLSNAKRWLAKRKIELRYRVESDDFILRFGHALSGQKGLFSQAEPILEFDITIGNPPYFKLPKSDGRVAAAMPVVHGQPNIYALFMAVAGKLLAPKGDLIFITPRSFSSGPYFRLFREKFFAEMRPDFIHTFESRKEAFRRDSILQENIILRAKRVPGWSDKAQRSFITLSGSNGAADLSHTRRRRVPLALVLETNAREKFLFVPASKADDKVVGLVHSWKRSLRDFGLEISTGPVVSFRVRDLLHHDADKARSPMIWMQHVRFMNLLWPLTGCSKEQYISTAGKRARSVLLPNRTYIVMRRFSAKEEARRLTAAPLIAEQLPTPFLGLENHLNYIHRPAGEISPVEALGLSALLNSTLVDDYFRSLSGSTQVNAEEMRAMPLPELDAICELGNLVRDCDADGQKLDCIVDQLFR